MPFNISSKLAKMKYGAVIKDTIKVEINRFAFIDFKSLNTIKKLNIKFTPNPANTDIIKITVNCGSVIDSVTTL